jgi:hypothetical protein
LPLGVIFKTGLGCVRDSPAEDTKNEVEHEEGSNDDEGNEVHPVEGAAQRVVGLREQQKIALVP